MPAPQRIALLSSASGGGGGIAASRMAEALNRRPGITAHFLTIEDFGGYLPSEVVPATSLSNRKLTDTHFTLEHPGYLRQWVVDLLSGHDMVNVHWASYLVTLAELDAVARRGTPMMFHLHDFHYITGGCHYPAGCTGMARTCHACPQFDALRGDPGFLSVNLRAKRGIFARSNVHLAAPSQWLRDQAVASGIIAPDRAHVLRNPYVPLPDQPTRPSDGTLRLLVVADSLTERRKGMTTALEALNRLADLAPTAFPGRSLLVDVVGHAEPGLKAALAACRAPHRFHGRLSVHSHLTALYATCDLVLTCSTEDNWPNILVEAGAYGCVPVVGPGHGCAEFVRLYDIGRVATDYSPDAFAHAMIATLTDLPSAAPRIAAAKARIHEDHDPDRIAGRFLELAGGIAP